MKEELCFLREVVTDIAKKVPPINQQTPITKGAQIRLEAVKAHNDIEYYRINARQTLNCPNINSLTTNPSYPGKRPF